MEIAQLDTAQPDFDARLQALLARAQEVDSNLRKQVAAIIDEVRKNGIEAVCELTRRFDRWQATPEAITIPFSRFEKAWQTISAEDREALELAASRIRAYHERQRRDSWEFRDEDGVVLGMRIQPLDAVGIYVPGGKAAYPSSVLMNAIPARAAGVEEVVMVVPTPKGEVNELVLAAAYVAGVHRAFAVGGAQAIAALAFGAEPIPRVDKIVGPGNAYVAEAKRQLFGIVGIDMIAGPSEIVVVADGGNPRWWAIDLLSQAEHDEDAQAIFISTDAALIEEVRRALSEELAKLPRAAIAKASLANHGALIRVHDWAQAADLINRIAPEHLELALSDPEILLPYIRHAGAIFCGRWAPEAFGDYLAGPNHVLPTNGTARFASPLSVDDFVKKTSIIRADREAMVRLGPAAAHLAHREGLQAHARSLEVRFGDRE